MGAAAAAGWMVYQAVGTYNRDFHKSYFYYLITFYAFAIYALMGQQGLRWLLRTGGSTEEFVASAANFLAMLSLPFLFLSWGMLVKMGHNLVESKPANRIFRYHLAFLLTVIVIFWIGYYMLYSENLIGRELIFIEIGLLLLMELGYLVLFVRIVFSGAGKFRPPASRVIRLFAIILIGGWVVRAATLPFLTQTTWYAPLLLLFFFLSNGFPVLFMHHHGDTLFTPDLKGFPDERRKMLLFEKYEITPREREIVQKICEGKTNQQIADELFISLQTVKDHTHRIYSKIGIHSRLKLARLVNG
jgi:DNA-binding CsgD family transcriptional regulator